MTPDQASQWQSSMLRELIEQHHPQGDPKRPALLAYAKACQKSLSSHFVGAAETERMERR